jgi:acyl-CoA-binding protein
MHCCDLICNIIFTAAPDGSDSRSVAKFNAWAKLKGTSKESAMETYIKKYEEHKGEYTK